MARDDSSNHCTARRTPARSNVASLNNSGMRGTTRSPSERSNTTAVNSEGKREIIGMDVGTSEDGAFWLAFLRSLVARGLGGVELVV